MILLIHTVILFCLTEVEDSTLTLRALNDAKSSFASVEFVESFFGGVMVSNTQKSFSCKLAVKVLLHRLFIFTN